MIIDQCPHCKTKHVQTKPEGNGIQAPGADGKQSLWQLARCQNTACTRVLLVVKELNAKDNPVVYPLGEFTLEQDAPLSAEIREEFLEAGLCLNSRCFKASMVMSRRVLQRCLKEKGCTKNRLVDAIDEALANGTLRAAWKPVADEIRQYGNLGAHPDDDQLNNCTLENAQHLLEFTRHVIHDLFEVPFLAENLRRKRTGS